jgi:DNA-binding protein YbaB
MDLSPRTSISSIEDLLSLAEELRLTSERLSVATTDPGTGRYEGASEDEVVRVVLDGSLRVIELSLRPEVARMSPEHVSARLVDVVRRTLQEAGNSRQQQLFDALPPAWRAEPTELLRATSSSDGDEPRRTGGTALDRLERTTPPGPEDIARRLAELAEIDVTVEASDAGVVVTMNGQGHLGSVQLTHRTLRDLDNLTLADRVRETLNEALDRVDALRRNLFRGNGNASSLDDATARFDRRIDELSARLDDVERSLDG